MASSGGTMVSGTEKDRKHWRFLSVQARGCLSVTRRSGKQREQQRQLTGYLAMRGREVVGMGGTRLGDNASDIARLTRTALNRSYNDDTSTAASDEAAGPAGRCRAGQTPLHDNDANTVRGARPGQDPVGHDVGGTDPVEPDSNRTYIIILIQMMMRAMHSRPRLSWLLGRDHWWV